MRPGELSATAGPVEVDRSKGIEVQSFWQGFISELARSPKGLVGGIIIVLVLGAAAFVACIIPAIGATRVDPVIALRNE